MGRALEQPEKRKIDLIIRQLTESDIDSYNEASSSSFIWNVEPSDVKLPDGIIMGALLDDDKTVTAALECIPFENYFGASVIKCVGIGGVCSKPEYRRLGAVRTLFGRVFQMSAAYDWDFSLLGPFPRRTTANSAMTPPSAT